MLKRFLCLAVLTVAAVSCGGNGGSNSAPLPAPTPAPAPAPSPSPSPAPAPGSKCAAQWAAAKTVVQNNCASCHFQGSGLPALAPESAFDGNAAKIRSEVSTNQMPPPPRTLASADKQTLLDYLTCIGK